MSDPNDSTSTDASLSSTFLEFCDKVRKDDPSVLSEPGQPLRIRRICEKEGMELADALMENTDVTYLALETDNYTKSSAEAMAKYLYTSKRLQRIRWSRNVIRNVRAIQQNEEMLCCFLSAFQESTSLKKLSMELPLQGGPSGLALENMLAHTQRLKSLSRIFSVGQLDAAAASGLKKNTKLHELKMEFSQGASTVSPIFTSLRDHPLLRRLCLHVLGYAENLTGLETLLLRENSKITELEIRTMSHGGQPMAGLTGVLQALGRRPALTKLGLHGCRLGRDNARELGMVLGSTPSLQSLALTDGTLGSAEFAELAPAFDRNTSVKELDISGNNLNDMEAAEFLRDIIRRNKTMTALDLSGNRGAVHCIAEGLARNSTLLKIDLSGCYFRDNGVSILAQTLDSRSTALQKLSFDNTYITSTGVGVLLETMEQSSHHITDLELQYNHIGNEGATLLARSLGNNVLPNLKRVSLFDCCIDDDGFIALVTALKQSTSLLHLDLRNNFAVSERVFLALAESLPDIKVLQQVELNWCTGLASAMPLLLAGLSKNTSLFRFHVASCAPFSVPPTAAETERCAGAWMREMEWLGYRNRFLLLLRAPKDRLPPRGVWPIALARVAILPGVIFQVLRSIPSFVPSADTEGKEAAKDTGVLTKRKRGD